MKNKRGIKKGGRKRNKKRNTKAHDASGRRKQKMFLAPPNRKQYQ